MQKVKELFSSDKSDSHGSHTGSTTDNVGSNTRSSQLENETARLSGKHNLDSTTGGAHIGTTGSSATTGATGSATGLGHTGSNVSSGERGLGAGHSHNAAHDIGDHATHDHQHLAAVTKERQHLHETEEVTRLREHDRHVHHVASHVQPIKDVVQGSTTHHNKTMPTEEIREQHTSTTEDQRAFEKLHSGHHNEVIQGQRDRNVVDKGEIVTENVKHHVHHVVQPVIERDVHESAVHHTSIPVHQVTHEAPIIHGVQQHEPMAMKDFLAGGGDLSSQTTHKTAGVLADRTGEHGEHHGGHHHHESSNLLHKGETHGETTGARGASGLVTGSSAGVEGRGTGLASDVRGEERRL